jgi:hypothetical protein
VVVAGVVAVVDSGEAAGLDAGVTVSVFCSHAASSVAPVRMQISRFILTDRFTAVSRQRALPAVRFITALRISTRVPRPPPDRSVYRHEC